MSLTRPDDARPVHHLRAWLAGPPDAPAPVTRTDVPGWQALLVVAHRHGVTPLLHRRLEQAPGAESVPESIRAWVARSHRASALRATIAARQLDELLDRLAEAGVPALPLKGAYLGPVVYGDAGLRPMNDLDLLVPAAHVADAQRVALALGYRAKDEAPLDPDYDAHHHAPPLVRAGGLPVELHHALVRPDVPVRLDMETLLARARPSAAAGGRRMLAPEDVLVHLALHLAQGHRFRVRLLHLCDVAEVARRQPDGFTWARFVDVANGAGAGRFAYAALALARIMLDAPVPDHALAALTHDEEDTRIVADAQAIVLSERDEFTGIDPDSGRAPALRGALRSLAPTPADMRRIYALPPGRWRLGLYYALRPLDLLRRRGRAAWALLRGVEPGDPAVRLLRSARAVDRWAVRDAR